MNDTPNKDAAARATGQCLCGAVAFRVLGPMRPVINCHCAQCRRWHGTHAAYSGCARGDLEMIEERGLRWFRSSDWARRGFCAECGSSLFWERLDSGFVSIAAGSLDAPSGLATAGHIFTADKGDSYSIGDDLPRYPGSSGGAFDME